MRRVRGEKVEATVRENSRTKIEVDSTYYCCDMCTIHETGLNSDEYVEVSNLYRWVGTKRD